VKGWGAEQLTREELLNLGRKLRRGWAASVRQADRSPDAGQVREFSAVAAEVCGLWGEAADELIVRRERAAQVPEAADAREPEAGS
jgi:hypothetical protein